MRSGTSGKSNFTKRLHHSRTWKVQSYRQGSPLCTPSNTCFLGPTRVYTPKRHVDGFSRFFGQHTGECPVLYNVPLLSPQNCPCTWGSGPQSNTCFIGPSPLSVPNGISIGSAVFAQLTAELLYALQWAASFPSNLPLPMGIWTSSNTWFLGLTRVHNPNGMSICSAFLQGLRTRQTDRQTAHAIPILSIGRIYVRSTAMRPKIREVQNGNR